MKTYRKEEVIQKVLVAVTCDKCKKEYDDIMEMQEFLHYENDAGYGSVMGDGNRLRMDLCQHCVKEVLGEFIRTEGNYIWERDEILDSVGRDQTALFAHELPAETIEAIKDVKMDPKHDPLDKLLDEDFFAQSSFRGDKDE